MVQCKKPLSSNERGAMVSIFKGMKCDNGNTIRHGFIVDIAFELSDKTKNETDII